MTRQAAVTRAPALSSSVTAADASQITGPATVIMTVGTTATRPTQTAPIRVSVQSGWASCAGLTDERLLNIIIVSEKHGLQNC